MVPRVQIWEPWQGLNYFFRLGRVLQEKNLSPAPSHSAYTRSLICFFIFPERNSSGAFAVKIVRLMLTARVSLKENLLQHGFDKF